MPRFFKENFEKEPFLTGQDAAHIARSLRMRLGEPLTVCDKNGFDYRCTVTALSKDKIELEIHEKTPTVSEPDIAVTLCPCLTKGDKLETVIRHGVELGVTGFLPLCSANCVSRPDEKSAQAKVQRWNKLAAEAAGQSGRGILPPVEPVISLQTFLSNRFQEFDLVLFFYEVHGQPLGQAFWENDSAKKIAVITGPEGGFTGDEAEALAAAGAKTVTLGPRILRAETAPLAAVTGLMLLSDNLE